MLKVAGIETILRIAKRCNKTIISDIKKFMAETPHLIRSGFKLDSIVALSTYCYAGLLPPLAGKVLLLDILF